MMRPRNLFLFLLLLFNGLACWFAYKPYSVEVDGTSYYALADDQMISMRYAKNFARYGELAWNPGQAPTEGFSNPLWVGYMTLWHLAPMHDSLRALPLPITNALLVMFIIYLVFRIGEQIFPDQKSVAWVAAILTASYYPMVDWATGGFEVTFISLVFVSISYLWSKPNLDIKKHDPLVAILFSLAILSRLETVVLIGAFALYRISYDGRSLQSTVLRIGALPLLTLFTLLISRDLYFGEWVPNTYFLKLSGMSFQGRVAEGIQKVGLSMIGHMPLYLAIMWIGWLQKNQHRLLKFFTVLVLIQIFYSVAIGGDTWENYYRSNRYISTVMPLGLISISFGLMSLISRMKFPSIALKYCIMALMVSAVCILPNYGGINRRYMNSSVFWELANKIKMGVMLKKFAPNNLRVAVIWAGALPYYSDLFAIDLLGKNDKFIAKQPTKNRASGHNKWDCDYSIRRLKPDYIASLLPSMKKCRHYLKEMNYIMLGADGQMEPTAYAEYQTNLMESKSARQ
jgi:hypothetical protein